MMLMFFLCLAIAFQLAILGAAAWALHHLDWAELRARTIDVLGNLMADVLEHPRVKIVMAQAVTNGMNHTMEQPDLGMRLHKLSESMREDNIQMSRTIGEQLPALAHSFVGGAVSAITRRKTPENKKQLLEQKKKTEFEAASLSLDSSQISLGDKKKTK